MMSLARIFGQRKSREDEGHWLSVSDLMAGLMMIFMFIAISFMRHAQIEKNKVTQIVVIANDTQLAIYKALHDEFKDDLKRWNAEIDRRTMTIRFKNPDVLFNQNSDQLKPRFERILSDFFPRYLRRLAQFKDSIAEIRIEGHTSTEWNASTTPKEAYFLNMALSQSRTRSVLEYCLDLPGISAYHWLRSRIAAVGLSSSRPIYLPNGKEDKARSRRVEFTVQTNFERRIIERVVPNAK